MWQLLLTPVRDPSRRGDIAGKTENLGVLGGLQTTLSFPVVDLMLWALCRYEDEIRLCSGMEFTFMELKKVSRRGRFPAGLSLPSPAHSGKGLELIQAQLVWDDEVWRRTGRG